MIQKDIELLEIYYREALETQKGVINFGDFNKRKLNVFKRLKAKRSIEYFKKIQEIEPDDFRLHFFIGKNYESLNDLENALFFLENSVNLNKNEPILPFEASIVAIKLELNEKALHLIQEAIKRSPEDEMFIAVHAMYLLISGNFTQAQIVINQAFQKKPKDNFIIESCLFSLNIEKRKSSSSK